MSKTEYKRVSLLRMGVKNGVISRVVLKLTPKKSIELEMEGKVTFEVLK